MSFELEFLEEALAEWKRFDGSVREQFNKKLAERLIEPGIPSAKLSGHPALQDQAAQHRLPPCL